jgi:hypothetical protein
VGDSDTPVRANAFSGEYEPRWNVTARCVHCDTESFAKADTLEGAIKIMAFGECRRSWNGKHVLQIKTVGLN